MQVSGGVIVDSRTESSGGGGGGITSASNGLHLDPATNVKLGGELEEQTEVFQNGFDIDWLIADGETISFNGIHAAPFFRGFLADGVPVQTNRFFFALGDNAGSPYIAARFRTSGTAFLDTARTVWQNGEGQETYIELRGNATGNQTIFKNFDDLVFADNATNVTGYVLQAGGFSAPDLAGYGFDGEQPTVADPGMRLDSGGSLSLFMGDADNFKIGHDIEGGDTYFEIDGFSAAIPKAFIRLPLETTGLIFNSVEGDTPNQGFANFFPGDMNSTSFIIGQLAGAGVSVPNGNFLRVMIDGVEVHLLTTA